VLIYTFLDEQLDAVLTQVLAIPLASELPTPNARKTCALSIWLLQTQRLSSEVLLRFSARIAYALRRGMDGELGKEGKKGSVTDSLRVRPIIGSPGQLMRLICCSGNPRPVALSALYVCASVYRYSSLNS
jgi:hypothetical protein